MSKNKEVFITAFALFSLFFGAGNLVLPPFLGLRAGALWWWVTLGFCLSAVLIPILGIRAHARLQGTLYDFGKKISPTFSWVYAFIIYAVSVALPSPRTAAVAHEMAVSPWLESPPILTSLVYFSLVLVFVMNRSRLLNLIGKWLTPAILLILFAIIGITLGSSDYTFGKNLFTRPLSNGFLEGYQTFDAIGAVVVGGVILVSINLKDKSLSYEERKLLISRSGWWAGGLLFLVYGGLILSGALVHREFGLDVSRTQLLSGMGLRTLGGAMNFFTGLLVSLACFTTAVGIVAGAADFAKHRCNNSKTAYLLTAIIGCVLGVVMGQLPVSSIIALALTVLMFVYPVTIVLILLNLLPDRYTPPKVFQGVVATTLLFSVPDFLGSMGLSKTIHSFSAYLPLSPYGMGWAIPAVAVFMLLNLFFKK
ncbi:MAG: branched-chain amino acid transport system II carrier protein [Bacteroidota bacterium]